MTPLAIVVLGLHAVTAAVACAMSRCTRSLRPIAVALLALFAIAVARAAIAPTLDAAPLPYTGVARVVFGLDVAAFGVVPAVAVGAAVRVIDGRRWWPPVACCGAYALVLVACYPWLHGAPMIALQGMSRPLALVWGVECVASVPHLGERIRARPAVLPALVLIAESAGSIGGVWVDPWTADQAWDAARVVSIVADVALVGALVWAGRYGDRE